MHIQYQRQLDDRLISLNRSYPSVYGLLTNYDQKAACYIKRSKSGEPYLEIQRNKIYRSELKQILEYMEKNYVS